MDDAPKTIGAIENAYEILRTLQGEDGMRLSEITRSVSLSKSAVYNQLVTLESIGFVNREGDTYSLGLQLLTLGGVVRNQNRLFQAGRAAVDELSQEVGELCSLTVEEHGEQVVLYQVRREETVMTDIRLGHRESMYCTATGKAMLAFIDKDRREEIIDQETPLLAHTSNSITDVEALREELVTIKERGISFNREERIEGMRAVSAPVQNRSTDELLGALAVAGPASRFQGEYFEETLPEVIKRYAQQIEVNATFS